MNIVEYYESILRNKKFFSQLVVKMKNDQLSDQIELSDGYYIDKDNLANVALVLIILRIN